MPTLATRSTLLVCESDHCLAHRLAESPASNHDGVAFQDVAAVLGVEVSRLRPRFEAARGEANPTRELEALEQAAEVGLLTLFRPGALADAGGVDPRQRVSTADLREPSLGEREGRRPASREVERERDPPSRVLGSAVAAQPIRSELEVARAASALGSLPLQRDSLSTAG